MGNDVKDGLLFVRDYLLALDSSGDDTSREAWRKAIDAVDAARVALARPASGDIAGALEKKIGDLIRHTVFSRSHEGSITCSPDVMVYLIEYKIIPAALASLSGRGEGGEPVQKLHQLPAAPDWNEIYRDTCGGDGRANELVTVTRETARLASLALRKMNEDDYYHNNGAAEQEIIAMLAAAPVPPCSGVDAPIGMMAWINEEMHADEIVEQLEKRKDGRYYGDMADLCSKAAALITALRARLESVRATPSAPITEARIREIAEKAAESEAAKIEELSKDPWRCQSRESWVRFCAGDNKAAMSKAVAILTAAGVTVTDGEGK